MLESFGTHAAAFLFGAVTGAADHYFGSKYTDRRRTREVATAARRQFDAVDQDHRESRLRSGRVRQRHTHLSNDGRVRRAANEVLTSGSPL